MISVPSVARVGILVLALGCLGCGNSERQVGETVERSGQPPVTYVSESDPKMSAAIKKAQDTVDEFIPALNSPKPTSSGFAVKMPVTDGKNTEHMWVSQVSFKDGKFNGVLGNEPDTVKTFKLGQPVEIAKNEISDWMYIDNSKLVGGYTLRVLRDSMPEKERAEFDRSVPFTVE